MKVVVVLFALVAVTLALPAHLNWKYGEKPKDYRQALLRSQLYGSDSPMDTVVDCLAKDSDYSTLVKLATAADLVSALKSAAAITVFAPTNAAFDMIPKPEVEMLLKHPKLLAQVILGHATASVVMANQLMDNEQVPTMEENMAKIHISFSKDGGVFADAAKVTGPDACKAGNGVVHKVDRVIMHGNVTVVEEGLRNPMFSTLVAAVKAAGLVDALNATDATLTLFAPVNEAFMKIESVVTCLLKPENKGNLVKVLTYHVAPKVYYSRDLVSFSSVASLEGDMINVMVNGDKVMIDKAMVLDADVPALNGVIHVINEVILPNTDVLGPCKP